MRARLVALVLVSSLLPLSLAAQVIRQRPPMPGQPGPGMGQPRDPSKPTETGTAVIRGRVVAGDTGQPLRRAMVRLGGEGLQEGRMTTTDEQGRYEFRELPAGRLSLVAMKAGYVMMQYGQRRPREPGRPLELGDGQVLQGVDFNLPRGGVIAGRITDEYGEPLAEVTVQVMRYHFVDGRRQLVPAGFGPPPRTDDQGRYRAYGLPPGDYYVQAALQEGGMFFGGASSDTRTGFTPTYYPGTPTAAEAQRVRVAAGGENAAVSFALVAARTVEVSGTVIDSLGQPLGRGFIMVQEGSSSGGMMFNMRGGGAIRPDGTFRIGNLAPGEYVLHVNTAMGPGDADAESAAVPVSVGGDDLTGLSIVTSRAVHVTGQIVSETGTAPSGRPSEFQLWAMPAESGMMMRGGGLTVKDDWTVEGRLPAETPFLVRAARLPDGWMLKTVLHDGVDVTDSGLLLRAGSAVHGLQLVISDRTSTLTGGVADDRGAPARDYVVLVFPEDTTRWTGRSRHIALARPDQQGRFELKRLPAAQYLAVALESIEEGQQHDPEFLQEIRSYATPFQLGDGEQKALSLRLVTMR